MKFRYLSIAILLATLTPNSQAGWEQDWFDNSSVSGPSSFETQKRGYLSAGGFTARIHNSAEPLITISPPRIKSGCGGIDAFWGGMSFMDADYLMDKFNRMATQSLPAVAFDTALKVVSKELSETFKSITSEIDKLNNTMLDECSLSQGILDSTGATDAIQNATSEAYKQVDRRISQSLGTSRNWHQGNEDTDHNGGQPVNDTSRAVSSCPPAVRRVFANGMLLDNIANGALSPAYIPYIRGLVGDISITYSNNAIVGRIISSCPKNNKVTAIEQMVEGEIDLRNPDESCTANNDGGFKRFVHNSLVRIANNMATNTQLSQDDINFIQNSPVPVYSILSNAVYLGDEISSIANTEDVISYGIAFYSLSELYNSVQKELDNAQKTISSAESSPPTDCDLTAYVDIRNKIPALQDSIYSLITKARAGYNSKLSSYTAYVTFSKAQFERRSEMMHQQARNIK